MKNKIFILVFLFLILFQFKILSGVSAASIANAPATNYSSECPTDYYDSLYGLKSDALLNGLAKITNENHKYYNKYEELKGGNSYADADPNDSNNIIDFYSQHSYNGVWSSGVWQREHVWCQSRSGELYPDTTDSKRGAGADIHAVRQLIGSINGSRNNSRYGEVENRDSKPKYYNFTSMSISESGDLYGYLDGDAIPDGLFEPKDEVKGDVARILMYLYMHYSSEVEYNKTRTTIENSETQSKTGNLDIKNIVYTSYGTNQGAWDLLLKWNENDEVDELEINRNNYCASVTGTRNPFIDHCEFAEIIWDKKYDGLGALIDEDSIPASERLDTLMDKYYNDGIYTRKTEIHLKSAAENEIEVYFHGGVALDRTTYHNGENLLMGDLEGSFDKINSGYKTSDDNTQMDHYKYDFNKQEMVIDYSVSDTTLLEFYPTLKDMFTAGYFSEWQTFEYVVSNANDKYLNDFLAITAPCLTNAILKSNYFNSNGIKLTVNEVKNSHFGDYLSLKMYVNQTDASKVDSDNLLSEARIYQGNKSFNDTLELEDAYSYIFTSEKEVYDSNLEEQKTNSGVERNITLNGVSFKFTPIWKNVGKDTDILTGDFGYDDLKGVKIGSTSNPATSITLETELSGYVSNLSINLSTTNGVEANLSIYIDEKVIAEDVKLTNIQTVYDYKLETLLKGNLRFVITQPETDGAIYLQSISLNSEIKYERFEVIADQGVLNGKISVDKNEVIKNDEVTVTITPDEGYTLEKLLINGINQTVTGNTYKVKVTSKTVITATFMPIKNDDFTWSNKFSNLENGTYKVLLGYVNADGERFIAPTTFTNNKFRVSTYNSVTDYTNYTFTIIKTNSNVTIKLDNSNYLAYNSSTNFKKQTTAYTWAIQTHDTGNEYLYSTSGQRTISGNISSNYIGPYLTSNYTNGNSYAFVEFAIVE